MNVSPGSEELASRLRRLRSEMELTQAELAEVFAAERSTSTATISSWEKSGGPPAYRLEPYARLAAIVAAGGARRLVAGDDLATAFGPDAERHYERLLAELTRLKETATSEVEAAPTPARRSWSFDEGPITIIVPDAPAHAVGPLADPGSPNFTKTHTLADVDALIELYGHIRAENPRLQVDFIPASETKETHLTGHVVLIGGVGWNETTRSVLPSLGDLGIDVDQVDDPEVSSGEIFVVGPADKRRRLLPLWSGTVPGPRVLVEDVGLLVRVPNPYNSTRTLTFCNGIHSRGVVGAVRALIDPHLRDANEAYLGRGSAISYAVAMRIPVVLGQAISPDLSNPRNRLYEWTPPSPAAEQAP